MRGLEWKTLAVADLMAIVDYISDDSPKAAQALKEDIETKALRLRENQRLYRSGRRAPCLSQSVLLVWHLRYRKRFAVNSVRAFGGG